jgi:hypothetical protein
LNYASDERRPMAASSPATFEREVAFDPGIRR